MSEPAVRGRHLKGTVERLAALPEWEAIRARIPPAVLEDVARANGFDWLPVTHDVALVRAGRAVLGADRHRAFAEGVIATAFHGPLLGKLAEAALRLLGRDPGSLARWIPKGWVLMFRDCGRWTVTPAGPGRVALSLAQMAPPCVEDGDWAESVGSSLGAVISLTGAAGRVELARLDRAAREAGYLMTWSPPPPAQ